MVGDIEFLETVCKRMQQVGLVASKSEFSVTMLGKTPSYLTSMKARKRRVPAKVVGFLQDRLRRDHIAGEKLISSLNAELQRLKFLQKHRLDLMDWIERQRLFEADRVPEHARRKIHIPFFAHRLLSVLGMAAPAPFDGGLAGDMPDDLIGCVSVCEQEPASMENDPVIIYSDHCATFTKDGITVDLQIYRLEHSVDWSLEVVNEAGTSTVWDDPFTSDDEAYAEFVRTVNEEGMGAFAEHAGDNDAVH